MLPSNPTCLFYVKYSLVPTQVEECNVQVQVTGRSYLEEQALPPHYHRV